MEIEFMENQNREPTQEEVIDQKLMDSETPGHAVAFDPTKRTGKSKVSYRQQNGSSVWVAN
jgi:hypothetical protein